jgi:hypothetical protein
MYNGAQTFPSWLLTYTEYNISIFLIELWLPPILLLISNYLKKMSSSVLDAILNAEDDAKLDDDIQQILNNQHELEEGEIFEEPVQVHVQKKT